jgi:hypothetical protein
MPTWQRTTTVTRSTLCWAKRLQIALRLTAPGRVPAGAVGALLVTSVWSGDRIDPEVKLTWARLGDPPGGEVVFGDAAGAPETTLTGTSFLELPLFGRTATPGAVPDVELRATVDGDTFNAFRVAVGAAAASVAVLAEDGVSQPVDSLRPGVTGRFKAVPGSGATGTFQWVSLEPTALVVQGSATDAVVAVEARVPVVSHRTLAVLFSPAGGGPDALGVHRLLAEYLGRIEDRSAAPKYGEAATGHVFLPGGTPITIVNGAGATVASAMVDATGRFDLKLPPGGPYELRVPGLNGLG